MLTALHFLPRCGRFPFPAIPPSLSSLFPYFFYLVPYFCICYTCASAAHVGNSHGRSLCIYSSSIYGAGTSGDLRTHYTFLLCCHVNRAQCHSSCTAAHAPSDAVRRNDRAYRWGSRRQDACDGTASYNRYYKDAESVE